MSVKRIVFYVMCAILAIMIIVSGIAIGKVSSLAATLLNSNISNTDTQPSGTNATEDATGSSENPTESAPSEPTEPSAPTDPTEAPTSSTHQHTYTVHQTSPATCTEEGYTLYKCDCGDIETRDMVNALGHSYGAGKVVTACEGDDACYTQYECSRCGYVDKRNVTDGAGHKYDIEEKFPATCTDDAYTVRKCSNPNCTETVTEVILGTSLGGHDYSVLIKEVAPTCTEGGYKLYACANEGCTSEPEQKDSSPKGHTFTQWKDGANGKESSCTDCNLTVNANQLEITKDFRNESNDIYVIEIGTGTEEKDIRRLFTYNIEDKRSAAERSANPISYNLDSAQGLVVTYKDASGAVQTEALGFKNNSLTIESASTPTEGPSEAPTEEPTTPDPNSSDPTSPTVFSNELPRG